MSEFDAIRIGDMVIRRDLFRFAYVRGERVEADQDEPHAFTVVIVFEGDLALEHPEAQRVTDIEEAREVLEEFHADLLDG